MSNTKENTMLDDYIKRSDAINALKVSAMLRNLDSVEDGPAHRYKRAAERIIAGVPAADVEPKRKTGRWIDLDDHLLCSSCGASHTAPDKNYCPNCGAKMDKEEDDGVL